MELSKKDKKAAHAVIDKGLDIEFARGLSKFEGILNKWKSGAFENNRAAYHELFKSVTNFDKHIARRYDGLSGSRYWLTVLEQLRDGVIHESDLEGFEAETRQKLMDILR